MKLSKLTDYGLVLLSRLAAEGGLHSVASLSEKTSIPEPTISKLMKLFAKNGLVMSVRGANGGYRLNGSADEISAVRVIEAIEGPIALTECAVKSYGSCALEGSCRMNGKWGKINLAVRSALEELTLRDLV